MVRRVRRPDGSWSPLVLAGWLLADLAAALVVILLAAATDNPAPQAAEPNPSVSASSSPEPVTRTVQKEPVRFTLRVDADGLLADRSGAKNSLKEQLTDKLDKILGDKRQAAIVLTFGVTGPPDRGTAIARAANGVLTRSFGGLMKDAASRDFWTGGTEGTVEFEFYLFAVA